jgi:hypothetical protein
MQGTKPRFIISTNWDIGPESSWRQLLTANNAFLDSQSRLLLGGEALAWESQSGLGAFGTGYASAFQCKGV